VRLNELKVQETEKLMFYLSGSDKLFLKAFLVKMDVEALRVLIRGLARNDDLQSLKERIVYSRRYTNIPFEQLAKVTNWDDFKKLLRDSDYFRIFEIFRDLNTEQDLIMVEKNLDRYFYDLLRNRLLKLNQHQNLALINAYRRNFDLLNVVWIYRGIKFYHLSREELLAYSLRGGLELNERRLPFFAGARDLTELKELLSDTDYAFLLNHTQTIDLYMERRQERYLYYLYHKLFREGRETLALVVAYIRLLDFEIEDITSIIESKRYRLDSQATKKFLIRSID
jgi:V/A-type H+-transporting ATPase subunit C